ncbi:MAG: M3 family peptidase [Bacteroidia bacterium]|nr:M3 family peptidase [Bacteroidia bacterium]
MKKKNYIFILILMIASNSAFSHNNPFLKPFSNIYQTVPFSQIEINDYTEGFNAGLEEQSKNIQTIIDNQDKPTFENTIVAIEHADEILGRVANVLFNLTEAETNNELDELAQKYSPKLTEASNKIFQNEDLFAKVNYIYQNKASLNLDTEDFMLLEETYKAFIKSGANLSKDDKKKFSDISSNLSKLTLSFGQNVLKETNAYSITITDKANLLGLPDYALAAAEQKSKEKGLEGWTFDLSMPSYSSFMRYAENRELRENLYRAYNSKSNKDNQNDNRNIVKQVVNNRLEIAKLMHKTNFAAYKLENTMAEDTNSVYKLLNELLSNYKPTAEKEFKTICDFAKTYTGDADFQMQSWDWSFFSEKYKEQNYDLNDGMLKPYFELDRVKQGLFWLAGELYGLQFKYNPSIDVYNPEVQAYEVRDKKDELVAILYTDFFPRASKQGGAWMTEFRGERVLNGKRLIPLISIVMNFTKPIGDTPSLLTFDELTTFLHEFGHSLHGMLANTKYASLSGTNVYRDFVELPSQLMENFATEQAFLDKVGIHYQTGEKIPAELVKKIKDTENYNVAYFCVRQLNFGFLDMAWHTIEETFEGNVEEFEHNACSKTTMFPTIEGTCISTQFNHIFSGGYAAGYYSYKWAEVLDADAYYVFKTHGGIDRATAESFKNNILSKGGTEHPMTLYKRFRGQEPTIDALLKRNGIK